MFGVKSISNKEVSINQTDIKSYAKYILQEGGIEEKREMLIGAQVLSELTKIKTNL